MAHVLPRRVPYVCKACRLAQITHVSFRSFATSVERRTTLRQQLEDRSADKPIKAESRIASRSQQEAQKSLGRSRRQQTPSQARASESPAFSTPPRAFGLRRHGQPDLKHTLKATQEEALLILGSDRIPEDGAVVDLFQRAQQLADTLVNTTPAEAPSQAEQRIPQPTPAQESRSSLLADLNESQTQARAAQQLEQEQKQQQIQQQLAMSSAPSSLASTVSDVERSSLALTLVKTLYTLLEDPKLYISERILTRYVSITTTLHLPQYLPKIFHLYAHKPIPKPGSYPIQYSQPWSRAPKYSIPPTLIDAAISSAITARDMPLCITLIDLTVNTPQFKLAKFIRRAAAPLTLSASIVPLSWALSTRAASWQLSWDPDTFFWMCMAGSAAYLGTMGTLLLITITTWNDHHKRVRWVPGTPLGRRWFREEERYYFDKIAQSWGYQDEMRHGEEVGEEWEALRECLGLRYLELDRSSLLPGML